MVLLILEAVDVNDKKTKTNDIFLSCVKRVHVFLISREFVRGSIETQLYVITCFFFRKKPLLIKPHVFYKKLIAEIIFLHWHKLKKFKTVLEIAPKT